mmetsp:Transcript_876/g.2003  ORF Transcript_876/g.2003 Transcript_876/m.2003 type:complete len:239 (+) Transcript_876:627-1343(+)
MPGPASATSKRSAAGSSKSITCRDTGLGPGAYFSALDSRLRRARRSRLMSISAVRVAVWRRTTTRSRWSRGRSAMVTAISVSMSVSSRASWPPPASRLAAASVLSTPASTWPSTAWARVRRSSTWRSPRPARLAVALCSAALALFSGWRTSWASTSRISERSRSSWSSSWAWDSIWRRNRCSWASSARWRSSSVMSSTSASARSGRPAVSYSATADTSTSRRRPSAQINCTGQSLTCP